MIEDLLFLVSFYSTDRDRLTLILYCNIYFKFITDFKLCCINNYIISIKILSLTNDIFDWNWGLLCACWDGHRDLVDLMIEKGANDWDGGLHYACKYGYCNIAKLMIQKGATNWNGGLEYACQGGHLDLVNLMIEKGANNWNEGLDDACEGGHLDLVNLMIENGATECEYCGQNAADHLI